MGRYWIKACVCVLLFAAFDVSAGNLPLLGAFKLRFQRYWNYNLPDLPKRTMTLPGGAKIDFVWVKDECRQGFWISKYEVTEAQWYSVMRSKPFLRSSTRAAENVSWEDCQEFCRRAGEGMRLPAEFEWTLAQKAAERFLQPSTQAHYVESTICVTTYGSGARKAHAEKIAKVVAVTASNIEVTDWGFASAVLLFIRMTGVGKPC